MTTKNNEGEANQVEERQGLINMSKSELKRQHKTRNLLLLQNER